MSIAKWPHRVSDSMDPDATLDYQIDWSDWLASGESITGSSWTVNGASVLQSTFSGTVATVWITNATVSTVMLSNKITTDSAPISRVDERTLLIPIAER